MDQSKTVFSVTTWEYILEVAKKHGTRDIQVELGINRKVSLLDKEGHHIKDVPGI